MTVTSFPQPLVRSGRGEGTVRAQSLAPWAGAIVAAIAIAALASWGMVAPAVSRAAPGLLGMNPLTALCLLLSAVSLLLLTVEPVPAAASVLARLCAASVLVAAMTVPCRLVLPWDPGLDLVLFPNALRAASGEAARMAPATGFNFIAIGLALLLLPLRIWRGLRPAEVPAVAAGALSLMALLGRVYQSAGVLGLGPFTPGTLITAACFLVLSGGIIGARPGGGLLRFVARPTPGGLLARRLLPAAIMLPLLISGLAVIGQRLTLLDAGGGVALLATSMMFVMAVLVWRCAIWLDTADRARGVAERQLHELNEELEGRVSDRTHQLGRINEALLDQTRFLHQVLDTSPQLVYVKDWSGRFTLANQAMADLYGQTVEGLIGKTDADFIASPEAAREALEVDREVMSRRQVKVITEEPAVDERTGEVRWFHTIKAPLVGRDGVCNRVLGHCTDITARHFAEAELRRASDELRALFDASPLAICGLSSDGYVRSWNRAAERLFGWLAGEVVGRPLPIVPPELRAEYRGLRESMLAGNATTNIETRRVRKDGEVIAVSVSTAPLHDASGRINGIVVVYGDIRQRRELEAQLRQAQKMEAVGQLAGGVAHDFNNLLTVIQTASELLMADVAPGDRLREDIADIQEAASRAASLTRQLLAYSRQQVLEPRVVDLNTTVRGIEPMARRLVQENIAVVTRLAPDLHAVTADPHQLDQVLLNLVINARDAMPEGGTLVIETSNIELDEDFPRTHPSARPGPHVLLSVTDCGCGMDEVTRGRIFEPFFTTKPLGVGTGLGLATVYGIVKQSGGHIWVRSEVGEGASFKIYLPVSQLAPPKSEAASAAQPDQLDATPDGEATILVVEDDDTVRSAVRRVLQRRGYDVLESPNGEEALRTLTETRGVDLVISDIVMPEMSGLELRDRMKERHPQVPVLLMSGYSQEAITRLGNHESLGPLIEKPFTVDGLLDNVRSVLGG